MDAETTSSTNDRPGRSVPPVLCEQCGDELWWGGSAGRYEYLHVTKVRADHRGRPRKPVTRVE